MIWFGISPPIQISLAVMLNPSVICETVRWQPSISWKPCVSQAFVQSFFLPPVRCTEIYAEMISFLRLPAHYCRYLPMVQVRLEARHFYPLIRMSMAYGRGCSALVTLSERG